MKLRRIRWRSAVPLLAGLGFAAGGLANDRFQATGEAVRSGAVALRGEGFELDARVAPRRSPQGGGYVLTPGSATAPAGAEGGAVPCACFNLIFADAFESGNAGAWDSP